MWKLLKRLKNWLRSRGRWNIETLPKLNSGPFGLAPEPSAPSSKPKAENAQRVVEVHVDHRCCVCQRRAIQAPRSLAGSDGEWYGGYFCDEHFCQPGWLVIH